MKKIMVLAVLLMGASAFAGEIITKTGYVQIAEEGTYKGQYIFAETIDQVSEGIKSPGALPESVELLELCDRDEFKTPYPNGKAHQLNRASIDVAKITVSYFDNGHPLAGMCVEKIEEAQEAN